MILVIEWPRDGDPSPLQFLCRRLDVLAQQVELVIVHGSGPGPRIDYGVWVGLYASLGLTVLAYDKCGNGASTGAYPGEFPSDSNLAIYAGDAAAALRFLTSWPGVDPKRVRFHGGSQGGWVVPLAIGRHQAPAAFAPAFAI